MMKKNKRRRGRRGDPSAINRYERKCLWISNVMHAGNVIACSHQMSSPGQISRLCGLGNFLAGMVKMS